MARTARLFGYSGCSSQYRFSQHLNKLLFGVVNRSQQFVVEMQDLGTSAVSSPAVIHGDVTVQLSLNTIKSAGYVRINCFTNGFCQCRPRVDFDGGNLHQRQKEQNQTAPAS